MDFTSLIEFLTPSAEFDLNFFLIAVPAVLIAGISKGGFVGGLGMLAVPMMSLFIDPRQAAAVMLPILIGMDIVAFKEFKGEGESKALKSLLPGALIGIIIGGFTFYLMNADMVRVIVGGISLYFVGFFLFKKLIQKSQVEKQGYNNLKGGFWGMVGGFTSFIAHAGGPPFSLYVLPLQLPKRTLLATSVTYFMVVNLVKLIPYFILGQLVFGNLIISLYLLPLAPIGVRLGVYLHTRISERLFYIICYSLLFFAGVKLTYSGILGSL